MPLAGGTRLGPYEIVAPIGAGGMGEVYRARDTRLGREVAVKVSAEKFSDRFEREARTIATLNHPNICTLYDVGPNYLVMELIEGPTLGDRIKQGAVPLDEALAIATQIIDAIDAAHQKGIVHRDLKPANIKVSDAGQVKVLDFGLAKALASPELANESRPATTNREDSPTITAQMTKAGMILGTAAYMPPEQARGKPVDKRADIWAFGVVFYEMLAGVNAFDGESITDVLAAVVKGEPDYSRIPAKVQPLLRRCLEKDPQRRLRDIGDARLLLEDSLTAARSGRTSRTPLVIASAIAALAIIAAAVAFWAPWRQPDADEPVQFHIDAPDKAEFVLEGGSAISPDGRTSAYVAASNGVSNLWVRPLDSLTARELPGTEGVQDPFWSPDNRSLGFFAGGKLKRIDVSGGPPALLADAPNGRGGAWGEDGTILFSGSTSTALQQMRASGGSPSPATVLDAAQKETSHRWPEFLPGGRQFLYLVTESSDTPLNGVYLGSLDQPKKKTQLFRAGSNATYSRPRDKHPGYLLWLRENTLTAQVFDAKSGRLSGEPFAVPGAGMVALAGTNHAGLSVSNHSAILYTSGIGLNQLSWLSREGKVIGAAIPRLSDYASVRISPDGSRVASTIINPDGERDVSTIDLARGVETRVSSRSYGISGIWSPDGSTLVYFAGNGAHIAQKSASGAGQEEIIYEWPRSVFSDDWSPDGKDLLYEQGNAENHTELWLLPMTVAGRGDRKPRPYLRTQSNLLNAQFSPDGKWVSYTSDESGQQQVYVERFPAGGQRQQVSSGGGNFSRWRRDGKELLYIAPDRNLMAASVRTVGDGLAFTTPVPLFRTVAGTGPHIYTYDISPDGRRILAITPAAEHSAALTLFMNWQAKLSP